MLECDRCGEKYNSRDTYSTPDYCGTCVFINGKLPESKFNPQPTRVTKVQPRPSVEGGEDSQPV
jgi:hypothetical protein